MAGLTHHPSDRREAPRRFSPVKARRSTSHRSYEVIDAWMRANACSPSPLDRRARRRSWRRALLTKTISITLTIIVVVVAMVASATTATSLGMTNTTILGVMGLAWMAGGLVVCGVVAVKS